MARLVSYAESLGESTTTAGTGSEVTKVSVSPSLVNGTKYLIIASCVTNIDNTTTTNRCYTDLYDSTGASVLNRQEKASKDATDYQYTSHVWVYSAAATASRTFALRFRRPGTTGNAKVKSARILVIELGANDVYDVGGSANTTSSSYQDLRTVTFTPASTGDYLFIAWADCTGGFGSTGRVKFLTPAGADVNECAANFTTTSNTYVQWATLWKLNLAASSQTAKIQYRSTSPTSVTILSSALIAIRLGDLYGSQTTQDDADDGGTQATYTTSETLAATGVATSSRDTIVLAAFGYTNSSTTESSYIQVTENGTQMIEGLFEASGANKAECGLVAWKSSVGSGSFDYDIDRQSESTATTTTVNFAAIALLEILNATTYNQSLSATLTATASIRRTTSKIVSATCAFTASIRRTVSKTVSATCTFTGSVRKTVGKTLSGTLPLTATLSRATVYSRILSATVSLTGAMTRTTAKVVSGTVTFTADMTKTVGKTLSATVDLSASMFRTVALVVVATIGLSASMVRTIGKVLTGEVSLTAELDKIKAAIVTMSADLTMTASMTAGALFTRVMEATITLSASISRTIDKMLVAALPVVSKPLQWVATLLAAFKDDKPNWNQCARCNKSTRPNKLQRQMEYRGPRLVWAGLYVCDLCEDIPHPQGREPRILGGDPRPVPNARPRKS